MNQIKIAIADDHPMVIEGIATIIYLQSSLKIIDRYGTGKALLEGLSLRLPDVLLLDIQFPDTTGNELIRILTQRYPSLRILVVTNVDNPFHIRDMLQHGALGYVLKSIHPEMLLEAIMRVSQGETFLESVIKEQLLQSLVGTKKKGTEHLRLTKREQEILELVCEGCNNYEIADRLFLSHRTIENHRLSLYQKFAVKNTASLVKSALLQGLVH